MQSIKPEAREFITQASLGRASVEKVAAMLPGNDAELDEWIGEAVRDRDAMAFTLLVLAAFSRERAVDGRHLVGARNSSASGRIWEPLHFVCRATCRSTCSTEFAVGDLQAEPCDGSSFDCGLVR